MKEKTPKKAYKDPTADLAIGRIMREEKYKKKRLAKQTNKHSRARESHTQPGFGKEQNGEQIFRQTERTEKGKGHKAK